MSARVDPCVNVVCVCVHVRGSNDSSHTHNPDTGAIASLVGPAVYLILNT